jgi:CGNR zinc finger protein
MVPKHVREKRSRAIETGGFLFDEGLTRAALKLAGSAITTRDQAAELFREVARGRPEPQVLTGEDGKPFAVHYGRPGASFGTQDWQHAQSWLRRWLPKIAAAETLAESSAAALAREFAKQLGDVPAVLRVGRRRSHFELTLYTQRDSIAAASMRAVVPFLLPYGWMHRLGRCQLRECGEWFLQESRTGPPRQYCGVEHANRARVRRFRQRHV